MATRTRRTFNSSKNSSKSSSSIPRSTTKYTATGQDYSVTNNARANAINLAKANSISAKKSAERGEAYDPSVFEEDMGKNPISPVKVPSLEQPETPQQIDTSQPSPKLPLGIKSPEGDVITDNVTGNQYKMGSGGSYEPIGLQAKYTKGLQADLATGTEAAQDTQAGLGAVSNFIGSTAEESPSVIGDIIETDTNFDSILTDYDDYFAPETQRKSLLQEYKALSKSLGIEDMNEELIDAQRIIEGTEDDIRSEVTAVSGMATESQILSMSLARNKSLIKNYNALLASRDNAMTQLSTMMQLTVQDRQSAEAEFDRKMNFAFKVAEFKERAVSNAREGYNSIIKAIGYDGLLQSAKGDPYQMSLISKTLGMTSAQLQIASARAQEDRQLALDDTSLDKEYKKAQIANIYSEIGKRNADISGASTVTAKQEQNQTIVDIAKELRKDDAVGKKSAVGASLAKLVPGGMLFGLQPEREAFNAKVDTLKSNLTLDNLKLLKGAMSDKDLAFLQSVGSSLSTGMSETEFNKELDKIITKFDTPEKTGREPGDDGDASIGSIVKMYNGKPTQFYRASDGMYYPQ